MIGRFDGFSRSPGFAIKYLLFDRELDNYTYDISNTDELIEFVAEALGSDRETVGGFVRELAEDESLSAAISAKLRGRRDRNSCMPYGRRLGWYAVVRLKRPKLVVETGVHDGLGSVVLLRALQRNSEEGYEGRLVAIDIRADVGWIIDEDLRRQYELHVDSGEFILPKVLAGRTVDVFIHDSDHSYAHEMRELLAILDVAADGTVVMSDNAQEQPTLRDFCASHGFEFRYFQEFPVRHFFPGGGIGLTVVTGLSDMSERTMSGSTQADSRGGKETGARPTERPS